MKKFFIFFVIFFLLNNPIKADDASNWLKKEIDLILNAYKNENLSKIKKFDYIEETINNNFAGTGIAKFVAGKSWSSANKKTKKEYIKLFKKHLALSIASMLQGYSNQEYSIKESFFEEKNSISIIDMEIKSDTNSLVIRWRLKQAKERFFIIDLIVADISLVVTKRSEFNSTFKKVNYDLKSFNKILHKQNELSYSKFIQ